MLQKEGLLLRKKLPWWSASSRCYSKKVFYCGKNSLGGQRLVEAFLMLSKLVLLFIFEWSSPVLPNALHCAETLSCKHGGRILWRRRINFLLSYSYTSWYFWGVLRQPSWAEAALYEWVHWLPLWGPTNSCSVISDQTSPPPWRHN